MFVALGGCLGMLILRRLLCNQSLRFCIKIEESNLRGLCNLVRASADFVLFVSLREEFSCTVNSLCCELLNVLRGRLLIKP